MQWKRLSEKERRMFIFILLLICHLVTIEDFFEYWSEMLLLKDGCLGRWQYLACTWVSTFVIALFGIIILERNGLKYDGIKFISLESVLGYGFLYLIITFIQLSAFFRRMNDAMLSHWYALVFLIPGIGNIIAFIIAMLPSGFGDPYRD